MKNLWMLAVVALLAAGCGGNRTVEGRPAVYPTSITILHNGQPVEGATVTLQPQEGDAAGYGKTDEDGVAEITTFDPGDGAIAGGHLVRVRKVEVETAPDPNSDLPGAVKIVKETHVVPEKYERFETSGLTITVSPDGESTHTLELTD